MGDKKVQNWLVSLFMSTVFGMFVTLPIQVKYMEIFCLYNTGGFLQTFFLISSGSNYCKLIFNI
jgi:hypothetical protein